MVKGEAGAFERFVLLHRPLARHGSKWLQRAYCMDADEAEQIAMIGLIEAARRFNPERGFQFSTYAIHWVRQACQRLGPDAALLIRLPVHVRHRFFQLRRHLERLAVQFGRPTATEEIERRCADNAFFASQWLGYERALSTESLSDRRSLAHREARQLPCAAVSVLDTTLTDEQAEIIRAAIERLRPRDAKFLRLRYGIDGCEHTLEEIGQAEGLTRERVRQIVKRGEDHLRLILRKQCALAEREPPTNTISTNGGGPSLH